MSDWKGSLISFEGPDDSIRRVRPPIPSPLPLPRGVWRRDDPLNPAGLTIVEIWMRDGRLLLCTYVDSMMYDALVQSRFLELLDLADAEYPKLRAI